MGRRKAHVRCEVCVASDTRSTQWRTPVFHLFGSTPCLDGSERRAQSPADSYHTATRQDTVATSTSQPWPLLPGV